MSTSVTLVKEQESTAAASLLKRLLFPSFTDLFFALVMVWSFLAGVNGWQRLFFDGDTGLHIRVGDYILAHHYVPAQDPFSFSKAGQPWIAFEWLSEVAFSFLNSAFGLKGIALLCGIIITALVTVLLLHTLWRGANGLIAMALVLMTLNATNIHFHARPHLFTLLFLSIAAWMIAADRRRPSAAIWLLVPLTVVWTNLHGGFFIFLSLLPLLAAGAALEACLFPEIRDGRKSDALRYGALSVACGFASLVNPYGWRLHAHVFEVVSAKWVMDLVDEFKSPAFRSEQMLHFMALLFLGLAISVTLLQKRRVVEALWIVYLAYCSLVSVRHAPIYMVVAAPIIAEQLSAWWETWARSQPRQSVARILSDLAAPLQANFSPITVWTPLFLVAVALSGSIHWPVDLSPNLFPIGMVRKHADQLASGRVFASDQWADYLVYRNYPRQRVFIDGRHQFYGQAIVNDYLRLGAGHPSSKELLDKYQFNWILIPPDAPLSGLLEYDPRWKVVDRDEKAVLLHKIDGSHASS